MKLTRIEGPPITLACAGCGAEGTGGTEPYVSAASGETRAPEEWYQPEAGPTLRNEPIAAYCVTCAAKLVEEDPTRSVSQFYSDTAGTQIEPEIWEKGKEPL